MKKYMIWDEENKEVIKDNIPTYKLAFFIEDKLLARINHCVIWTIREYII